LNFLKKLKRIDEMNNGNAYEIDFPTKVLFYRDEKGLSYGNIAEVLGRSKDTVYKVYQREVKRRETFTETIVNDTETAATEQQENAILAPEKAFSAVSETFTAAEKRPNFFNVFHPADLLYYSCVAISGAGIVGALHVVGFAVAAVLLAVAPIALHGIKTVGGWGRLPYLFILLVVEVAGFLAHLSWANEALWRDVSKLPFQIWADAYRNNAGELVRLYGGPDTDKPFIVACGVAVVLFFVAVFVCWVAINGQKRRAKQ
jgi:hypothetical protein